MENIQKVLWWENSSLHLNKESLQGVKKGHEMELYII